MEQKAHKLYIKAPGEVQARKIVEDEDTYKNIVKEAREKGVLKPNQDFDAETKERIFRQMKPSEKGVLQGQSVKVDSGGNTTSPIRAGEEQ